METELYRAVACSDRLPETEGRYIVLNHGQWHEANYCEQYNFHEEMMDCSSVTHWMESIELPNEEDISKSYIKNAMQYRTDLYVPKDYYIKGASFILNHFKGEQP